MGSYILHCNINLFMLRGPLSILIIFLAYSLCLAQTEDCSCLKKEKIKVCYTSNDDYCINPNSGGCGYAMDGVQMESALALKLTNPAYFGPSGTVNCEIVLDALPKDPDKQDIEDLECDIIFIGNHPFNDFGSLDVMSTPIPQASFDAIREWSTECDYHLVIVTQAEADA